MLLVGLHVLLEVRGQGIRRVTDLHRPAAEHVGGADEKREADVLGNRDRLIG